MQLSARQQDLVDALALELSRIDGVMAVALGGSRARGRARADSDIDLGVLYREAAPFEGRHAVHHGQQPPFGYWSGTALGELAICTSLHDPSGRLAELKARVATYPEALRRAVVADGLWGVEFGLRAFAPKLVAAGDVYGTTGCLSRFAHQLVLVVFALNRAWLVNDKTALAEIEGFRAAPDSFAARTSAVLARPGTTPAELGTSLAAIESLWRETVALAGELYAPRYTLPGRA